MNKTLLTILLAFIYTTTLGQGVGIGTNAPDVSSILELKSTTRGFLPPRMTAAEKTAIVSPKAGLIIYQTDNTTGLYIYNGVSWQPLSSAASSVNNAWSLQGNSGTTPATNFIGTLDDQPLMFRVNNLAAGTIDLTHGISAMGAMALGKNTNGTDLTAVGFNALASNTTGDQNTAVGSGSLFNNVTGEQNTATGSASLVTNVNGNGNTAIGYQSQYKNFSGNYNSVTGYNALYFNRTGHSNVAMGAFAMYWTESRSYTVAIGDSALAKNGQLNTAGGVENVAVGSKAMAGNTEGSSNTAVGFHVMNRNSTGTGNAAIGSESMFENQTGSQNTAIGASALHNNNSGNGNTTLGSKTMFANTTGDYNLALGAESLTFNSGGDGNVAVGYRALENNFSGSGNVAIGRNSLAGNYSGNDNVAIGYSANISQAAEFRNAVALGAYSRADCNACVVLGPVASVNGALLTGKVGIGLTAPTALLHLKQTEDTYPSVNAGFKIERSSGTNNWTIGVDFADDLDFTFNGIAKGYIRDADGAYVAVSDARMKKDVSELNAVLPLLMQLKPRTYHYKDNRDTDPLAYGFMAQDVEKLFPSFVTTKGPEQLKGLAYQNFNVIAIKAIQEQQEQIALLQKKLTDNETETQRQLSQLQQQVKQLTELSNGQR